MYICGGHGTVLQNKNITKIDKIKIWLTIFIFPLSSKHS